MSYSHMLNLIHPLTGEPIVPVGYRANGRPIWPIMGAAEGDGDGGDGGAGGDSGSGDSGAGGDSGGQGGSGDGTGDGDTGGDGSSGDNGSRSGSPWNDPAKAKAEIERLRKENASDRTKAKKDAADEARTQLAQEIGKALGIVEGDKTPTVEELTKELGEQKTATDAAAAAHREAQAELVVWRASAELGVDPQAVTDSRGFAAAIKDLDPTDDKFEESVKKAAQEAAEKNPKLKATQGAGSSSADHGGSGGGTTGRKPVTLDQAVAGHYGT